MDRSGTTGTDAPPALPPPGGASVEPGRDWLLLGLGGALVGLGVALVARGARRDDEPHEGAHGGAPTARGRAARRGGIRVRRSVTVSRAAADLYDWWRDLGNLPRVMSHLERVEDLGGGRSRWTARGPAGRDVVWEAEITEEHEAGRIAWRSLPGATVANEGEVRFVEAPAGRGTEVRVDFRYHPPLGPLGAAVAALFGEEPHLQVASDLHRFQAEMEAGEAPTTEGQASGRAR